MAFFERYLTLWVLVCIAVGVALGRFFPELFATIAQWKIGEVNLFIAALIWLMIYPMMVRVDLGSFGKMHQHWKGITLTLVVNWLIKPFTMALFAWFFIDWAFDSFIGESKQEEYIAGAILLGAAPCTAMVFVWSYLTKGDSNYTLIQVSLNDLVLLVAFVPLVGLLLGISDVPLPLTTLVASVLVFVAAPLALGLLTSGVLAKKFGQEWLEKKVLRPFRPLSIVALLATLVVLFAFQGETLLTQPLDVLLIAVPLTIQTIFIWAITWYVGKSIGLSFEVCGPSALIGASNFFELAVAVAISLFGLESGASLATVVGVLIEVPVMLLLVRITNRLRYPSSAPQAKSL